MSGKVKEVFDQLITEGWTVNEYSRRLESSSGIDLFLAVIDKKPVLWFPVSDEEKNILLKLSPRNGFEIRFEITSAKTIRCFIYPREKENFDLFFPFIENLLEVAAYGTKEEAKSRLIARIRRWAAFFEKCPRGILDRQSEIGLWGELYLILIFLQKEAYGIVDCWKGPAASTKDFVFGQLAVEVKTTIRSDTNRIHISDENQLDDTGFENLILCNLIISEDNVDGYSLPDLVEHVRSMIHEDEARTVLLNEQLKKIGYEDAYADLYEHSYSLYNMFYYKVDSDFPRIIPSDLRNGVKSVSYCIEISLCQYALMDYSEAEDLICAGVVNE